MTDVRRTDHDTEAPTVAPAHDTMSTPPVDAAGNAAATILAPKTKLGRYQIERELGAGAMGTVYLARDTELDRRVALKVPKFKGSDSPEMIARFIREARAAATLHHRNVCPVFDIGSADGAHYITMAFIEGRPLSDFIGADPPPSQRQIAITVRKLALALAEAHAAGVIHRDLKPSNIIVDKQREPVVMDFGLARQLNLGEDDRLTQSHVFMGTPAYMSPEQVEGERNGIGPASDVYSLGVIFYELLTGTRPFQGSVASVIGQILNTTPKRPSELRPDIDPRLDAICSKMMAKATASRYATMNEVAADLTRYLEETHAGATAAPGLQTAVAPTPPPKAQPSTASSTRRPSSATIRTRRPAPAPERSTAKVRTKQKPSVSLRTFAIGAGVLGVGLIGVLMFLMGRDRPQLVPLDVRKEFQSADTTVAIDNGEARKLSEIGDYLQLMPGKHNAIVRQAGEIVLAQDFMVIEGQTTPLILEPKQEEPAQTAAPAPAQAAAAGKPEPSSASEESEETAEASPTTEPEGGEPGPAPPEGEPRPRRRPPPLLEGLFGRPPPPPHEREEIEGMDPERRPPPEGEPGPRRGRPRRP